MTVKGTFFLLWRFFWLLLYVNPSITYSLKKCTIIYQENSSADVLVDCANRKLITFPDDIPKYATSLDLLYNDVKRINREDLSEMSNLKNLNLRSNEISHVDDRSFNDLTSLKILSIRSNRLTNLTNNMFQGLFNLTVLDLHENQINLIENSALKFLISLEFLDLSDNQLCKITDIIPILQLPQIRRLSLDCNHFSTFETQDLPMNLSSSLNELKVSSSSLDFFSITTSIFPFLQKFDVSRCGCPVPAKCDVPDKALVKNITQLILKAVSYECIEQLLTNLLSLHHLQLSKMEEYIRKGLLSKVCKITKVKRLDLFDNDLDNFSTELSTCYQLTTLDLSKNRIAELPKGSIQQMELLQSLNVSHNLLSKVPHDVRSLACLKILDLNSNRILELTCEDFMNATNLTELYLNENRIVKLDKCVVQNLTDLKRLDLSNNLLRKFGDTFKVALKKLEFLDLTDSHILSLKTKDFQSLESLKQLNVATYFFTKTKPKKALLQKEPVIRGLQQLENFTIEFTYEDALTVPNLSSYKAENIPFKSMKRLTAACFGDHTGLPFNIPTEMLNGMENLETFTAVNIYAFPPYVDMFMFNTKLKSLSFAETDLSKMNPELFHPIQNLQALDLSNSKLISLDFLVKANLSALRFLKLSNNELTVINETVFQSLPSLTYLDLSKNPFTCDCSNAGFIRWAKSNKQTQVANTHQYICSFPVNEQGHFLLDFDIHYCLNNGSFFYFISSTFLVVLTLLISFIHHFLKSHLVYAFYLFKAYLYDSRKRMKEGPHKFDAFISYNAHDEDWVYSKMVPVLEGEQGWRLCLHHRDFQPGKPILDNITEAIYGSRKTICVISRQYLQSEWCSSEIQMASFRLFDEQKDVLILLFLEEIPSHHLSPYYRMRKLVKRCTYLSWPQAVQHPGVFWQNVQRALQTGDVLTENNDLLPGPGGC
ncbi:toll-like receptor 13 isoform X1 [Cyprinodon tularosa]|uniref:toll-like receptor 13 isoform X1 n=3 Tax=Cyprinodon tularosa TaxID=77115 RepID=UPI0018E22555|nr:toll-like receptor 13 isoform X1 [Cyprinodon tularosa]